MLKVAGVITTLWRVASVVTTLWRVTGVMGIGYRGWCGFERSNYYITSYCSPSSNPASSGVKPLHQILLITHPPYPASSGVKMVEKWKGCVKIWKALLERCLTKATCVGHTDVFFKVPRATRICCSCIAHGHHIRLLLSVTQLYY